MHWGNRLEELQSIVARASTQPDIIILDNDTQEGEHRNAALIQGNPMQQATIRVFYRLSRGRQGSAEVVDLGFVVAESRNEIFPGLRASIQREIDPALLPMNGSSHFCSPILGAMSRSQEGSSGPVASFLKETKGQGDGSPGNPFRLSLLI